MQGFLKTWLPAAVGETLPTPGATAAPGATSEQAPSSAGAAATTIAAETGAPPSGEARSTGTAPAAAAPDAAATATEPDSMFSQTRKRWASVMSTVQPALSNLSQQVAESEITKTVAQQSRGILEKGNQLVTAVIASVNGNGGLEGFDGFDLGSYDPAKVDPANPLRYLPWEKIDERYPHLLTLPALDGALSDDLLDAGGESAESRAQQQKLRFVEQGIRAYIEEIAELVEAHHLQQTGGAPPVAVPAPDAAAPGRPPTLSDPSRLRLAREVARGNSAVNVQRYRLIPRTMTEEQFWQSYFELVEARLPIFGFDLHGHRQSPQPTADGDVEFEAAKLEAAILSAVTASADASARAARASLTIGQLRETIPSTAAGITDWLKTGFLGLTGAGDMTGDNDEEDDLVLSTGDHALQPEEPRTEPMAATAAPSAAAAAAVPAAAAAPPPPAAPPTVVAASPRAVKASGSQAPAPSAVAAAPVQTKPAPARPTLTAVAQTSSRNKPSGSNAPTSDDLDALEQELGLS